MNENSWMFRLIAAQTVPSGVSNSIVREYATGGSLLVQHALDHSRQLRNISLHDIAENRRIYLIVRVNQEISSIDNASPGNFLVELPKLSIDFRRRFADDLEIPTDRIHNQGRTRPLRSQLLCVAQDPFATLMDVHQIKARIFGRHTSLQGYSLGQYSVTDVRVQTSRLDQIDVGRQRVLQVRQQGAEIEQISPFIEIDQEIDVACSTVFPGREGAKNAYVPASVQFRQPQNLRPFLSQILQRGHESSLLSPRRNGVSNEAIPKS
jgi:hypothetical protein